MYISPRKKNYFIPMETKSLNKRTYSRKSYNSMTHTKNPFKEVFKRFMNLLFQKKK